MYDRQKPYNDLPDLPLKENILDMEIMQKWGLASRALAELNKNIYRIPNPFMLVNTISLQEAQSSTAIENIFTTEDELYKAVSDAQNEEKVNPATKEVLNYREALWSGYNSLKTENELTEQSIISIFQKIKNTTQSFRSPQSQVVIRRGNSDLRPGEVIYTPPRGVGIIEQKMENLLTFLKDDNGIDPLLKMTIAHYQFEAIHPFSDGNGRTGRILNLLYLINQNLLSHPVLYLSKYIIQHKEDYYHLLAGVTQRNAWKPWIMYLLEAVEQTAKHTNFLIDEIMFQLEATYQYGKENLKWYTYKLNQALFSQPYIKQKLIGEVLGVTSRTTLTKYAKELVKLGIVSAQQDGKNVFFINNDLMRILSGN
jgi:Fic family protein